LSNKDHYKGGSTVERITERLMAVLGKDVDEDDASTSSAEEVETRRSRRGRHKEEPQPQELTAERAAAMIDELPSDISRESASLIVRGALAAVGIEVSNLERVTRARGAKLGSEIELARSRQKEFREKTEEAVRSLEEEIKKVQEEIRKVQEAYDTVLAEEEKKISRALAALKDVGRVRAFFDFQKTDEEENTTPSAQATQPLGAVSTQERGHFGPPAGTDSPLDTESPRRRRRVVPETHKPPGLERIGG
jgi:hypothetical protein